MPTAFTHIFVAEMFGKTAMPGKMPKRFWILAAACSVLPDIDIIGYYLGIRYGDMFGHRGFFHSLGFALLASLLVVLIAFPALTRFSRKWFGYLAFFFVVTASHGFLDSMTDKGMGVGFFIPFDNTRYHMPWRPVYASPMKISRFFSQSGLEVLLGEIIWIWLPMLALYVGVRAWRKKQQKAAH